MSPVLHQTIFSNTHLTLGAKMIDFGGWEMPIHYGSQISEHLHTREHCSLFDVSHMAVVDVEGSHSQEFLMYLLANRVTKLKTDGQALYSCMLNNSSGILDDLLVYRQGNNYRLVINASTALTDLDWIYAQSKPYKNLNIIPRRSNIAGCLDPITLLALQGPQSAPILKKLLPEFTSEIDSLKYFHSTHLHGRFGDLMIGRTGYTGEDGFELFIHANKGIEIWSELLQLGARPAGLGARDTLRIEAGLNLYGQDMNEKTSPLNVGLEWTVDLQDNRNFIGKDALLTMGKTFNFVGLVLKDKGILRPHQKVISTSGDGEVTSGTYSPTMQKSIAFASVPISVLVGDDVQVAIRDQLLTAKVVKPCFVRNGTIQI